MKKNFISSLILIFMMFLIPNYMKEMSDLMNNSNENNAQVKTVKGNSD